MPLQYEIIHLFCAPRGHLAEIKRLDLPADASKAKVYQWLWIEEGTVSSLLFISMVTMPEQERTFEDAHLRFDALRGELRWNNGQTVTLAVDPDKVLPMALQWLVHKHLS